MVTEDYKELKMGLEYLIIKGKIPGDYRKVFKGHEINENGDFIMDTSNYSRENINNIKEEIDLEIVEEEDNLVIKGDF